MGWVSARVVDRWYKIHVSAYQVLISIQFMRGGEHYLCECVCAHIAEANVYAGGHRGNKGRKQTAGKLAYVEVAQI